MGGASHTQGGEEGKMGMMIPSPTRYLTSAPMQRIPTLMCRASPHRDLGEAKGEKPGQMVMKGGAGDGIG